jgi:hypothetical protein
MDAERFDSVTHRLHGGSTRRGALGALSAVGLGTLGAGLGISETSARKHKRKHKAKKPRAFCAGKNECVADAPCNASGPQCFCWSRADAGHIGEPLCGQSGSIVDDCADCPGGSTCVITGGQCGSAFLCALPCPNPL